MTSHRLALLLVPFRTGFTRPTWRKVLILLEGTLLARGRLTVTIALRMMGLHQLAQFHVFHHVLSRARWSPLQMSKVLFLLLVRTFVPNGAPIQLVVDETLQRRWGPHIRTCSVYHDPVRSTERSTPCLLALYSLVTLWGSLLYPRGDIPIRQTAWYRKSQETFADVLAAVRFCLWNPFRYPTFPENPDVILLPRAEVSRLVTAACFSP